MIGRAGQSLLLLLLILSTAPVRVCFAGPQDPSTSAGMQVSYQRGDQLRPVSSGSWVPSADDLLVRFEAGQKPVRAFRLEVLAVQEGKRVPVEVAGIQEFDKATRKWIHTTVGAEEAGEGRWIWGGTFRPGDEIVLQWRDADNGTILPHPTILRFVEDFGARLAFATPVSIIFPVTGDATITASAGFSLRYYRTSNSSFWRTLDRVGFPAIAISYASIAGEKSVLYSVGFSMLDDQVHLYYGGFRNNRAANNFWMFGLSLKTSDLMAAAKRALP